MTNPNSFVFLRFGCRHSSSLSAPMKRAPAALGISSTSHHESTRSVRIEGYQGALEPISVFQAKSMLSRAIRRSRADSGIQGMQGTGSIFNSQQTVRKFHTSYLQSQKAPLSEISSDQSVQGIQGEDCVNFKVWLESCQRYGLDNCDQQLQGIQTGRKTLAQVLKEQDDLIQSVVERFQQEASSQNQLDDIQGIQDWSQFPSAGAPCPQGIQGDDCVQFKLWLENCHRFGFTECMDQVQMLRSGRKSLGQVFAEQDQLIQKVVKQYQPKRDFSTSASDRSPDPAVGSSSGTPLTQTERLKRAVKEYGSTIIVFHIGISLMSLGGFYIAVSSGVDFIGLLSKLGVGESVLQSKAVAGAGTFVVAYAVHKVFTPVRIGITLTAAPFIVRHLRRIGFLKMPKPKETVQKS